MIRGKSHKEVAKLKKNGNVFPSSVSYSSISVILGCAFHTYANQMFLNESSFSTQRNFNAFDKYMSAMKKCLSPRTVSSARRGLNDGWSALGRENGWPLCLL